MLIFNPAAGATGDVFNLGTLGAGSSYGYAVNDTGHVLGHYNVASSLGAYRAFLYTGTPGVDGAMIDLATLGGTSSSARDINSIGQMTGHAYVGGDAAFRAFLYSGTPGAGGSMTDLGTLGGTYSHGTGINDLGQITGGAHTANDLSSHAFLYSGVPGSGGAMVDLGTLGGKNSDGRGINSSGQVVGRSLIPGDTICHAFLYNGTPGSGGMIHDLGTLGGSNSYGYAINNAGNLTGASDTTDGELHAFRYVGEPGLDGTMLDLGTLGGTGSGGWAINDAGFIAGRARRDDGSDRATLWKNDAFNTIVDLDLWLDTVNPTLGAQWTLSVAYGISDNGFITGFGTYNNGEESGTRAFLLDAGDLLTSITGDFDDDGQYTPTDIDMLFAAIQDGSPLFPYDLNSDYQIDFSDLQHEIEHLIGTHFGDTDLDGDVDLNDLSNLASGYGQPNGTWATGDTDGDGDVDLNDLSTLAAAYGMGEAQAFADFQTLIRIPEPSTAILLMGMGSLLLRRARQRQELPYRWKA